MQTKVIQMISTYTKLYTKQNTMSYLCRIVDAHVIRLLLIPALGISVSVCPRNLVAVRLQENNARICKIYFLQPLHHLRVFRNDSPYRYTIDGAGDGVASELYHIRIMSVPPYLSFLNLAT